MKTPPRTRLVRALAAVVLLPPAALVAQTTPSSPEASASGEEEIVVLSPFAVDATQDVGYVAQNTLAGTRLRASLNDVASPLTVLTREFLNDIGASDLSTAVNYLTNLEQEVTEGDNFQSGHRLRDSGFNVRMRGLSTPAGAGASRDYFIWRDNADGFNIERIEQSRGPNSILFGIGPAAGVVNFSTKRAGFKDFTTLKVEVGQDAFYRGHIDMNRVLVPNVLNVRLNLVAHDQETYRRFEFVRKKLGSAAVMFKPFRNTTLNVMAEAGAVDENKMRPWGVHDFVSLWLAAGRPIWNNPAPPTGPAWTNAGKAVGLGYGQSWRDTPFYDTNTGQAWIWFNPGTNASNPAAPSTKYVGDMPAGAVLEGFGPPNLFITNKFTGPNVDPSTFLPHVDSVRGPGPKGNMDYYNTTVSLEQRIFEDLFVELAYNRGHRERFYIENGFYKYGTPLFADPMGFLPDGRPNPNVGDFYTLTDGSTDDWRQTDSTFRGSIAYQKEFKNKWFNGFSLGGLYEHRKLESWWRQERLFLDNMMTFTNPLQNELIVRLRTYIDFDESDSRLPSYVPGSVFDVLPSQVTLKGHNGVTYTSGFRMLQVNGSDSLVKQESWVAASQLFFLDRRLVVTGGLRTDEQEAYNSTNVTQNGFQVTVPGTVPIVGEGDTYTLGAVLRPLPWLGAYYNESENFIPVSAKSIGGVQYPNTTGVGRDWGLRLSLWDNRLLLNIGQYETNEENVNMGISPDTTKAIMDVWRALATATHLGQINSMTKAEYDVLFADTPAFPGDIRDNSAEGYEVTAQANLFKNRLSLTASWSQNDTVQTNVLKLSLAHMAEHISEWNQFRSTLLTPLGHPNGTFGVQLGENQTGTGNVRTVGELVDYINNVLVPAQRADEGVSARGLSKHKANLWAKWSFQKGDGPLAGWEIGGGLRYNSPKILNYTTTNPATREAIFGNSTKTFDMMIGYGTRLFGKVPTRFQLNVWNVFDEDDYILTTALRDGTPYRYVYRDPRDIRLSAEFRF